MFAVVDQLRKELYTWLKAQDAAPPGPSFLRYHVIDMEGEMDIEFGIQIREPLPGDERVKPGMLPAGRYAHLIYRGPGLKPNKALLDWARENSLIWDRWKDPRGDAFRCRYEAYLTDPRTEPRKMQWDVDLAIRLADDQPQ